MDADGMNSKLLTEDFSPYIVGDIRWSPEGRHLAFDAALSNYANSHHVHVLNLETGQVQAFPNADLGDVAPEWRPCYVSK
jgi:hypothetical protein